MNGLTSILAKINLVQVGFENGGLVVLRFEDRRERGFANLPKRSSISRKEQVLGELLGEGAAALGDPPSFQIGEQRATDPAEIEAVMLIEPLIFDREDRLDQVIGQRLDPNRNPLFGQAIIDDPNGNRRPAAALGTPRNRASVDGGGKPGLGTVELGAEGRITRDAEHGHGRHPDQDPAEAMERDPSAEREGGGADPGRDGLPRHGRHSKR